jgi:prolyl-tRNA synthetase
MRLSQLFGETLREAPAEAKTVGHEYLLRAAYLRSLPDGSQAELTLGRRTVQKITSLLRELLENLRGQEIQIVSPPFQRDRVLPSSSLHIILSLIQKEIHSYRQLSQHLFHFQTQPGEDVVSKFSPLRMRATTSLESISLDPDEATSGEAYQSHLNHIVDIFKQFALPTLLTNPDVANDNVSHQQSLLYPSPAGDRLVLECQNCSYSDLLQFARMKKVPHDEGAPKPIEKVATPGAQTIADLATFLKIPESHTAKAVFSVATFQGQDQQEERLVLSIVRGDMELNEAKLLTAIGALSNRPAREEEIISVGAVPGFASPVGIKGVLIVVDGLIPKSPNLVAGANEGDFHYRNVNLGRDYHADLISDIVQVEEGDPCPNCGHSMHVYRGMLLGEFRRLPLEISNRFNITYLDKDGVQKPIHIGTQLIYIHHILAAVSEEHNDNFGLLMPVSISPYHAHLIRLRGDDGHGDLVYERLSKNGYDVLYDDREERPGVSFNDADLIGIPIRITVGKRSLAAGGVEIKLRRDDEREIVPLSEIVEVVRKNLASVGEGSPIEPR